MNDVNSKNDYLQNEELASSTLPTGINVLSILTFIGCAIQLITSVWNFFKTKTALDDFDKVKDQLNSAEMPSAVKSLMGNPEKLRLILEKSLENRLPILLLTLVAIALCFYGALEMRKLKKQGFLIYTIGELLPILTGIIFIGLAAYSGFAMIFGLLFALLFIILYFTQRKYLVN